MLALASKMIYVNFGDDVDTHQVFASMLTDACVMNKSNYFGPKRWS
jgi:hypothetical protein